MSVKLTLEFASEEEAIVALGKLVGLKARAPKNAAAPQAATGSDPASAASGDTTSTAASTAVPPQPAAAAATAAPRPRKPRADAGQPRGPNARTQNAVGEAPGGQPSMPPAPAVPTEALAPAASVSAAPEQTVQVSPASPAPTSAAAAHIPDEAVQKAAEKMFFAKGLEDTQALLSRFGVKRNKDLPQDQRQNFINRVNGVVDRGEAI